MIALRLARAGEAESLTALCVRSKAHWGYDAGFMKLCAAALAVAEEDIAADRVLVAVDSAGRTIGLARIEPEGETAELGLMFVDPPASGNGAGGLYFEAAARPALSPGAGPLTALPHPTAR